MQEQPVKVICENNGAQLFVAMGTTLAEVAGMLSLPTPYPFLAGYVNNKLRELDYRIYDPVSIRFIDITHYEGIRVYQRTLFFTMAKAVHDLYPTHRFRIKHSVSKGFYCEIEGREELIQEEIDRIRERMHELVEQDLPIVRQKVLAPEAEALYEQAGQSDKLALLRSRPHLWVTIYNLGGQIGYFYGALCTSTRFLTLFDLRKYYNGIYLAVPKRTDPGQLETMVSQDKMFDIFREYKEWVDVMQVSNVGLLNMRIHEHHDSELIKVAEAFHEKKLGVIADRIAEANSSRGARLVLISGPSSSGKTTFAKRLGIQLRILGLRPVLISLDDYFVERDKTPRDADGEYDYESLEAIDVEAFNRDLNKLLQGESVDVPRYNFITGKRESHEQPLQLDDRSVLVVEGIHGLNPALTERIDELIERIVQSRSDGQPIAPTINLEADIELEQIAARVPVGVSPWGDEEQIPVVIGRKTNRTNK